MEYKDTLNLPATAFPMKANLNQREPVMLAKWQEEGLYELIEAAGADKPLYVLHDGPPYANGHIHIGHAFGKILRDIVCKSERMEGKQVYFVPGWDCHGLPIELKVMEQAGAKFKDAAALKKACREYAQKWIETQREEFVRLGVLADWEKPYATMSPEYEANIIRAFAEFV